MKKELLNEKMSKKRSKRVAEELRAGSPPQLEKSQRKSRKKKKMGKWENLKWKIDSQMNCKKH